MGLVNSARFLVSFFRRPIATGAIAPSSRYLARRMVEDMALAEASTVVELGPGTGAFTGAIRSLLKPEALFLAVELNQGFAAVLREQFPTVTIINDSAEKLPSFLADRGRTHADSILCSLPWAAFPRDLQERLMKSIVTALRPGGRFCTFAYTHACLLPAARRFRELLDANFTSVKPTRTVWRNLPPGIRLSLREAVIHIGPAGWTYADWKGRVYPARPPRGFDALTFIASLFSCVEINSTFYRPCAASTAEGWVRKVAARREFVFTAKLWEKFTHGTEPWNEAGVRSVQEGLTPLFAAGRLAALLLQFPWNFTDTREARDRIRRIVEAFRGWAPLVIEVRHNSWIEPDAFAFLKEQELCFANIDQPKSSTSIQGTAHVTGRVAYLRLHGRNAKAWFSREATRDQKYDYLYAPQELEPFAATAASMAAQAETLFVITNNHFQGKAVVNAIHLAKLIAGIDIPMPDGLAPS